MVGRRQERDVDYDGIPRVADRRVVETRRWLSDNRIALGALLLSVLALMFTTYTHFADRAERAEERQLVAKRRVGGITITAPGAADGASTLQASTSAELKAQLAKRFTYRVANTTDSPVYDIRLVVRARLVAGSELDAEITLAGPLAPCREVALVDEGRQIAHSLLPGSQIRTLASQYAQLRIAVYDQETLMVFTDSTGEEWATTLYRQVYSSDEISEQIPNLASESDDGLGDFDTTISTVLDADPISKC